MEGIIMNSGFALLIVFGIGVVAGLRSMTAPAVVGLGAALGWVKLQGSPLASLGSAWGGGIFSFVALGEFVADQLPTTPARTAAVPLTARVVMGLLTGACLGVAGGASYWIGALIGAIAAIAGTFGGYQARVRLVRGLHVPDAAIAIPEDLVAIGLGLLVVSRF